jgi:hypothetical protein
VAKKQKRMTRQELREPDAVGQVLSGWWVQLERYWKMMVAGCFGLLIAGAATSLYNGQAVSQDSEVADAMEAALYPLNAPVGDADPTAPDYAKAFERFDDTSSARAAGIERIGLFLEAHGDSEVAPAARILRASLMTDDGAAITELEGAASGEGALQATTLMNLARQQSAAGQGDKAAMNYQKLADSSTGAIRALALMAMGDLQNPLVNAAGDAGKAREHYQKAKEALGPKPSVGADDVFASFSEPYLYSELDNKLALLD